MSGTLDSLTMDFLAWLAAGPRPYAEVMDVWRHLCPRLTIWEDAIDAGLVAHQTQPGQPPMVGLTTKGQRTLASYRQLHP